MTEIKKSVYKRRVSNRYTILKGIEPPEEIIEQEGIVVKNKIRIKMPCCCGITDPKRCSIFYTCDRKNFK